MGYLIAYLALTAFSIGWPEYLNSTGSKYSKQLNDIVKSVYSKMQQNNTFYEDILNAYNDKKSNLMTSIMMSNGFGARIERLTKAMAENQENFSQSKKKYDAKAAELNSQANRVQDLSNRLGTVAGNKAAKEYINEKIPKQPKSGSSISSVVTIDGVNQAVQGGLKE